MSLSACKDPVSLNSSSTFGCLSQTPTDDPVTPWHSCFLYLPMTGLCCRVLLLKHHTAHRSRCTTTTLWPQASSHTPSPPAQPQSCQLCCTSETNKRKKKTHIYVPAAPESTVGLWSDLSVRSSAVTWDYFTRTVQELDWAKHQWTSSDTAMTAVFVKCVCHLFPLSHVGRKTQMFIPCLPRYITCPNPPETHTHVSHFLSDTMFPKVKPVFTD